MNKTQQAKLKANQAGANNYYPFSEKVIIFSICAFVAYPLIDTFVNRYFNIEYWDSFFTKGIYFGSMVVALYFALGRIKRTMFILPAIIVILWTISLLLFPANEPFLKEIRLPLFLNAIPIYFITLAVRDFKRLFATLRITSIIVILAGLIFVIFKAEELVDFGYMEFSYQLVVSVMIITYIALIGKHIFDILIALTGFLIVFSLGARGPIVGILLGVIFYFLINLGYAARRFVLVSFITGITITIYIFFNDILQTLVSLLEKFNLNSRTIKLILNKEVTESTGRDKLFANAIRAINSNPVYGSGMAGDRVILGVYPHNFFLEIIMQYGIIIGSAILMALLYYILKSFRTRVKDEKYYIFISLFFSAGFVKFLFSSSYLLEPTFLMMIAMIIVVSKNKYSLNYTK